MSTCVPPISPALTAESPGTNVRNVVLLHNTILDPSTQDTLITIRLHTSGPSRPHTALQRYDIPRICRPHTHGEIGTITFHLVGPLGQLNRTPLCFPSFNGIGRVFYMPEPGLGVISTLEYDVRGNGDDREADELAKVVEYPYVVRFQTLRTLVDYDPHSGRICLQSSMTKYRVIEILDLAM